MVATNKESDMKISHLMIAIATVFSPVPAFAQSVPRDDRDGIVRTPVIIISEPTPEERAADERLYRLHVTPTSATWALNEARRQCRYLLLDHPSTIEAARREMHRLAFSTRLWSAVAYAQTGSAYAQIEAMNDVTRQMSTALAVIDCHKLLDPRPSAAPASPTK
jgi:hypothetical protein